MRFLADENFPFPVVEALRSFGYDVLTLSDLGKAGQAVTDVAVLKLASPTRSARSAIAELLRKEVGLPAVARNDWKVHLRGLNFSAATADNLRLNSERRLVRPA